MGKPEYLQFDIDDLAAVIRESIAKQDHDDNTAPGIVSSPEQLQASPELKLQPEFEPRSNNRYHINDLLRYHDRAFVQNAYRAILKRSPDATEQARALTILRGGRLNKIDLLSSLRFSTEGKAKGVQVDGLSLPAFVRRLGRVPLIGYLIRLAITLVRLPNVIRDQRQFDNYVVSQNQLIADFINTITPRMSEYGARVSQLETTTSKQLEVSQTMTRELRAIAEELKVIREQYELLEHTNNAHFDNLEQQLKTLEIRFDKNVQTRMEKEGAARQYEILKQQQLIKATTEDLRAEIERVYLQLKHDRATSVDLPMPKVHASTETHRLDAMYVALEDRFRGSHEEVKQRFEVYLPYLKQTKALLDAPLIDVGSGRGEWLELLKEQDIKAYGIERNRIAIDRCRARGLEVIEDDAIVHLQGIAAEGVGAVTGFHIIEHLPLDTLVHLLDQVMRVLRPGGLLIFETPNPENVVVGSNFFYLDPTHRHPLPSQLMQFLFEYRGFHRVEVINLHPWDSGRVAGEGELAERFNGYFFGPMDYAILGWKVEP